MSESSERAASRHEQVFTQMKLCDLKPPVLAYASGIKACSALNAEIDVGCCGQKCAKTRSAAQTILCRSACGMQCFGTVIWLSQRVRLEPPNTVINSAQWCTSRSLTYSHLLVRWMRFTRLWRWYWEAFVKFHGCLSEVVARSGVADVVIRPLDGRNGAPFEVKTGTNPQNW